MSFAKRLNAGLIGERLVEAGYLTHGQVRQALLVQDETALLFGEVCMLKGWITFDQLRECLHPMRNKLGHKLIACGLLTMDQLWIALREQRETGARLGEILVARGWSDEETIAFMLKGDQCPPRKKKRLAAVATINR